MESTISGKTRREMFEHEFSYELDGDTIVSPGKFEGQAWYAPIVYEWMMDGDGEIRDINHECDDSDGCQCEDIPSYTLFTLTDTDRAELQLGPGATSITLFTDDQGFTSVRTWFAADEDAPE